MTFSLQQRGVVMSNQITHTINNIHPLAHILDTCALIFSSCTLFTVYPNRIMFRVGGATSQLDLPSLTSLSIAGCGRLQLGAPHLATSVNYCT